MRLMIMRMMLIDDCGGHDLDQQEVDDMRMMLMIVMAMSLMNMRVMMVLGLITMRLMIMLKIIMTIYKFAKDDNGEQHKNSTQLQ